MSTIRSTTRPTRCPRSCRPAPEDGRSPPRRATNFLWRRRLRRSSRANARLTSGRIRPRYCATQRVPDLSTCEAGNSSSRASVSRGTAMCASSGPVNSRKVLFWLRSRRRFGCDLFAARRSCVSPIMLARCATPSTSRISATLPSPMMLAPANVLMPLSCLLSGFTTISSVSLIFVDDQAELAAVRLQDDDIDRLPVALFVPVFRLHVQFVPQVGERQETPAQAINRRAMHEFDFRACACSASSRTNSSRLTCGMA